MLRRPATLISITPDDLSEFDARRAQRIAALVAQKQAQYHQEKEERALRAVLEKERREKLGRARQGFAQPVDERRGEVEWEGSGNGQGEDEDVDGDEDEIMTESSSFVMDPPPASGRGSHRNHHQSNSQRSEQNQHQAPQSTASFTTNGSSSFTTPTTGPSQSRDLLDASTSGSGFIPHTHNIRDKRRRAAAAAAAAATSSTATASTVERGANTPLDLATRSQAFQRRIMGGAAAGSSAGSGDGWSASGNGNAPPAPGRPQHAPRPARGGVR